MTTDSKRTPTNEKKVIKQVIVVEGKSDTQRLKRLYDVTTIETNGSAVDQATLHEIKQAQELHGVIVFTDPDISGTKIRQAVVDAVPGVQHAFIERSEAKPHHKGSLGVEHASDLAIENALANVYQLADSSASHDLTPIAKKDLMALRLIGTPDAKDRRAYLSSQLHLGYVNGKQLAKRLALFQISLDQVAKVLENYQKK
ncbi:ribonuclease M5 [Aerococcus urinaeequi]|uniref:ribonuclease M5 n=1 Tax=Aerococcus sp. HMSC10H05 TaxID=1581084 RepID=UPI0008A456A7|nr:ribonuclease M5 [Aerococcus sp. HMSC10H05]OFU50668.1 ribonuclease M5 [Aerococcus sp. HMSC10H05]